VATIALTACGPATVASGSPPSGPSPSTEAPSTEAPPTEAPLPDGHYFAWVTIGEDEAGAVTLGIDLADLLTGEKAREAAIDAGVIDQDEDVPNDVFIVNPVSVLELVHVADGATFEMISGDEPGAVVAVGAEDLISISDGWHGKTLLYGVAEGEPIAMNVTIADGVVAEGAAVILP
jgi:hypothetical protein